MYKGKLSLTILLAVFFAGINAVFQWEDLPQLAKDYVNYLERELQVPIRWIGVGPARESIIERSAELTAKNVGKDFL